MSLPEGSGLSVHHLKRRQSKCKTRLCVEKSNLWNHSGGKTFTARSAYREALRPAQQSGVLNWPFLFSFPSPLIILFFTASLSGSPSSVLMFEFLPADRLSQIISFNSPCGTQTHSPCNFLIILFPFEALGCRLVRCQWRVQSVGIVMYSALLHWTLCEIKGFKVDSFKF